MHPNFFVSFCFVFEVGGSSAAEITFFSLHTLFRSGFRFGVLSFFFVPPVFCSFLLFFFFFTMLSNFCNGNVFLVHTNTYS